MELIYQLANVSSENLVIKRGSILGYMQSVDEGDIMEDNPVNEKRPNISRVSIGNNVDTSLWCKPLKELFHRSCENLTEDQ